MLKIKLSADQFATLLFTTILAVAGCGQGDQQAAGDSDDPAAKTAGGRDHSGWWCAEHGVPESECTRCDASLIAGYQDQGDWCDEHDRPESQCFICNPELEARFTARYEAKYGKKPPQPEAD